MIYAFGDCELDTCLYTLRRADHSIRLQPKVFQVLVYLLQQRDRVVSKQELSEQVWPNQFISDATLENCIKLARKAVGDDGRAQRCIQTRYGHGYRFVAAVVAHPGGEVSSAPPVRDGTDAVPAFGRLPHEPSLSWPGMPEGAQSQGPLSSWERVAQGKAGPMGRPGLDTRHEAVCPHLNSVDPAFCVGCSTRLQQSCLHCGQDVHLPTMFCSACGHPLTEVSPPAAERKPVTILCCTLVDALALSKQLELDALHSLMRVLYDLAWGAVCQYGGSIQPVAGDRFLAIFGAPVAHEDHAQRGVLAALELQQRLHANRRVFRTPVGVSLAVRMGIHTGLAVVGGMGRDTVATVVGETTIMAATLQEMAEPGTILCTDATARLMQGAIRLEVVQAAQATGQPTPVKAYRVLGLGPQRSPVEQRGERVLSPFVGRAWEIAALQALLAQMAEGQGHVVGIVGEPGIGKSRLVYEFRCSVMGRDLAYLEGRCLSHGSTTIYLPVLDLLRHQCDLTDADNPASITAKVQLRLWEMGMEPEVWAPYLLWLLGVQAESERLATLSPPVLKERILETLLQMWHRGSQQRPLVIVVEDLHWIDATSEECLAALTQRLASAPILLLLTYRPGYRPPWMDKSYATQLAIHPLSPRESLQVMRSILQTEPIPGPLEGELLAKAEGNPFFLEELAWSIKEHSDRSPLAMPSTVQAVLAARIDLLPPEEKHLLQAAAVIGKEVPFALLQALTGQSEEVVRRGLRHLMAVEFLYETGLFPHHCFTFKHALTQEAAYQLLLKGTRQQYHAQIAQTLVERFPEIAERQPELLAYHSTEAGCGI
jgi:class 3 adenylate cyclase/DNA-binding winged helix-turn-helix (wHTH) protein